MLAQQGGARLSARSGFLLSNPLAVFTTPDAAELYAATLGSSTGPWSQVRVSGAEIFPSLGPHDGVIVNPGGPTPAIPLNIAICRAVTSALAKPATP